MTTQLIPVFTGEIGNISQQVVNGRTLHAFLEAGEKFTKWISDRIKQYDFQEDADYMVFRDLPKKPKDQEDAGGPGRPSTEYHLTLDMAKELSMVERTPKGKEARRYFIECERQLLRNLASQPPAIPLRDKIAARKAIRQILADAFAASSPVLRKLYVTQAKKTGTEIGEPLDSVLSGDEMRLLSNQKGEDDE